MGSAGYKKIGPDTPEVPSPEIIDMEAIFIISDDGLNVYPFSIEESNLYFIHFPWREAGIDMAVLKFSLSIDCFD